VLPVNIRLRRSSRRLLPAAKLNPVKLLSKTKLIDGFRCPKALHLNVHNPKLRSPITPDDQARFDQGNEVGRIARTRFPGGHLITNPAWDFFGALRESRRIMAQATTVIFEAAFEYRSCFARPDVLRRSDDAQVWDVFEVKSSTKVKDEHLEDLAIQVWIMMGAGLKLGRLHLMHINPACRYPALEDLLISVDVTEQVLERVPAVEEKILSLQKIASAPQPPPTPIGPQCVELRDCAFKAHCWKERGVPELSPLHLSQFKENRWKLLEEGIVDLLDPRISGLTGMAERIVAAARSGERFVNAQGIREALADWKFPLVFLDFETVGGAVPEFSGSRPYGQVPFQYSVHLWPDRNSPELHHFEYLHDGQGDPRPFLLTKLLQDCGAEGSVVSYYSKFESDRLRELAEFSPVHAPQIESLIARMKDPLPLLREHLYDPAFKGSFSLKSVAPALLGEEASYKGMLVGDGGAAQRAYAQLKDERLSQEQRCRIREAMLAYCKKDTLVMVELLRYLLSL
jgi:hypothetical protein